MPAGLENLTRSQLMSVITLLKQADIFYELTNTQLELVASICDERHYQASDMVFEENSPGDELYVIADGEVEILLNPALLGKESKVSSEIISTLRRGQSFGEVALVDEGLRSAGARCSQQGTHLIVIPRDKLMLLCDTYPQLGYRLMRNLAADLAMKMRSTDLLVREQMTWSRPDH
jgi:CRP-like cAMP-binding protein